MADSVLAAKGKGPEQPDKPRTSKPLAVVAIPGLLILLPLLVYYLWYCMAFNQGQPAMPSTAMLMAIPEPTATSLAIVAGWITFQAVLQACVPGAWIQGSPLADGSRLAYKMNGWRAWWVTWVVVAVAVESGHVPSTILADHLGEILSAANVVAAAIAIFLWWRGGRSGLSSGGRNNSRGLVELWEGTELNPRIGWFDLKLFFEARPGLIGWIAIDLSLAAKQHELLGAVTTPMILVCVFQAWYVTDYFWNERAILTTWDIRHEKFGWMLCWGDLVWVPFTYTLQAQYLVTHGHELPWWGTAAIIALNIAGYLIFRGANSQKNGFRTNPNTSVWGRAPTVIPTAQGAALLASGWWGLSRHMNYFGDLLMGLAWCLPTLLGSPLPYFYIVFFIILLLHRERRDNHMCALRYGTAWQVYCARVPYRIVPWAY
jgi:protein-S-isoprenylcysteine O-methyltransferase Ste14